MIIFLVVLLLGFIHGALCYWDWRDRRLPTIWMVLSFVCGALLAVLLNRDDFLVGGILYGALWGVIWLMGRCTPRGPWLGVGDVLLGASMGLVLPVRDLWLFCLLSGIGLGIQSRLFPGVFQPLAPSLTFGFWVCFIKGWM